MVRLLKIYESSARERLKGRVKSSGKAGEELQVDRKYIIRVKMYEDSHSNHLYALHDNYRRLYKKIVEKVPEDGKYTLEVLSMFTTLHKGSFSSGFSLPNNAEQVLKKTDRELKAFINKTHIPEEYNVRIVAFFLQFLEERGFKIKVFPPLLEL